MNSETPYDHKMSDKVFLFWLRERLINKHNEDSGQDFMHRLEGLMYNIYSHIPASFSERETEVLESLMNLFKKDKNE